MQITRTIPFRRVWLPAGIRGQTLDVRWLRTALKIAVVMLPTLLAATYYGLLATSLYVSEARFVIRSASKPNSIQGGLNALMELAGMTPSPDDAYAVRDFLTSREALQQLQQQVDLRTIYRHKDADPLARYPSLLFPSTQEGLYRYFQHRLEVVVSTTTGLTTLTVQAFRAEDAQKIAQILLQLGENLVNQMNTRMQADAVRVAETEVQRAEQRRIDAEIALTGFRNRELILDPNKSSAIVLELIGRLSLQLSEARTQIAETESASPNSPQLPTLRQRAAALEQQIADERGRVASSSDGLADKIAQYERLTLQQEFAVRALARAVAAEDMARIDARRQQLFLERVVQPGASDEPILPHRLRSIFTVFGFNAIGVAVLWLLITGLMEHAGAAARR